MQTTEHPTIDQFHPTPDETDELEAVISEFADIEASLDALAQRAYRAVVPFLAAKSAAHDSGALTMENEDAFNLEAWGVAWRLSDIAHSIQTMFGPASRDFTADKPPAWYVQGDDPEVQATNRIVAEHRAEVGTQVLTTTANEETAPTDISKPTWKDADFVSVAELDEIEARLRAQLRENGGGGLEATREILGDLRFVQRMRWKLDPNVSAEPGINVNIELSPEMEQVRMDFGRLEHRIGVASEEAVEIRAEYDRLAEIAERETSRAKDNIDSGDANDDAVFIMLGRHLGYDQCDTRLRELGDTLTNGL